MFICFYQCRISGTVSRSTVPPGRIHFSLIPRHFVPGYFRLVPPGQDTLAWSLRDKLRSFVVEFSLA